MVVPPARLTELPIVIPAAGVKPAGRLAEGTVTVTLFAVVVAVAVEVSGLNATCAAAAVPVSVLLMVIVVPEMPVMMDPAGMLPLPLTPMPRTSPVAFGTVNVVPLFGRLATLTTASGDRVTTPLPARTRVSAPVPLLTIGVLNVLLPL